jgi:glycosyltransferase involved in cell wall biosynthesis
MRFAFLSTCGEPWGGSEEVWLEAAVSLRALGHRVDVLKTGVAAHHPRIAELRRRGCAVHDLRSRLRDHVALACAAVAPGGFEVTTRHGDAAAAAARLGLTRPDLALICQADNSDGVHLAEVCMRLGVPFVLLSQKAGESRRPGDGARERLGRAVRAARRSVYVSAHNLRVTEQQLGVAIPRATVLALPIRLSVGARPWPALRDRSLRAACVGRVVVSQKGHDLLLEALAPRRWADRDFGVTVYGRGCNEEGIRDMAGLVGVSDRVSFAGATADIEAVWAGHHALVLPSRREGLPLVLLEAMACGRVPIATAVGGIPELVEDGVTGFLAEAATVPAFSGALERAWSARERWPAIGEAAACRVAAHAGGAGRTTLAQIALEAARA